MLKMEGAAVGCGIALRLHSRDNNMAAVDAGEAAARAAALVALQLDGVTCGDCRDERREASHRSVSERVKKKCDGEVLRSGAPKAVG